MIYSHVAAMVLTNTILQYDHPYNEIFHPNRLKLFAGFTDFVKHNAGVVKQFVGKLLAKEEIEEVAAIAPGEGKIVHYDHLVMGLYKDDHGTVHAINPTCTHLKCSVTWNAAEKSWDCPCHGARYTFDGKVLNGPADKDLEYIEIRSLMEQEGKA